MGTVLGNDDNVSPKQLGLREQRVRYSSNKLRTNINACALWCLSGRDITPDDAGRAQIARGELRAGKERGIKMFEEYETLWRSSSLLNRQCVVNGDRRS